MIRLHLIGALKRPLRTGSNYGAEVPTTNTCILTIPPARSRRFSAVTDYMYDYSKLTLEERRAIIQDRAARGFPAHAPPHPIRDERFYLLTAACYQHVHHMRAPERRQQVQTALFEQFTLHGIAITAWVILPNHYHLLVHVSDFAALSHIFRAVHGPTSRAWNQADAQLGRRVWFTFADRAIRSERHYATTCNYIHYNPVKHGYAQSPYDWAESSVHWYAATHGQEWLRSTWRAHPINNYGAGWDD